MKSSCLRACVTLLSLVLTTQVHSHSLRNGTFSGELRQYAENMKNLSLCLSEAANFHTLLERNIISYITLTEELAVTRRELDRMVMQYESYLPIVKEVFTKRNMITRTLGKASFLLRLAKARYSGEGFSTEHFGNRSASYIQALNKIEEFRLSLEELIETLKEVESCQAGSVVEQEKITALCNQTDSYIEGMMSALEEIRVKCFNLPFAMVQEQRKLSGRLSSYNTSYERELYAFISFYNRTMREEFCLFSPQKRFNHAHEENQGFGTNTPFRKRRQAEVIEFEEVERVEDERRTEIKEMCSQLPTVMVDELDHDFVTNEEISGRYPHELGCYNLSVVIESFPDSLRDAFLEEINTALQSRMTTFTIPAIPIPRPLAQIRLMNEFTELDESVKSVEAMKVYRYTCDALCDDIPACIDKLLIIE